MRRWMGIGLVCLLGASAGSAPAGAAGGHLGEASDTLRVGARAGEMDAPQAGDVDLDPPEIRAGMFFDGAAVRVSALAPEGLVIAVSCVGKAEPVVLNRKGKALSLIWMNVGEVEITGAPDVYLLHASGALAEVASSGALESVGLGYAALEHRATVKDDGGEDHRLFSEFVRLKESDGLYRVTEGAVEVVESGEPGRVRAYTDFHLPPKTPQGEYRILVHGFGEGGGRVLGEAVLRVEQVGMAAAIRTLALDHGLGYGILAVVVAIAVGLLTGVLFGLGSRKTH